MAPIIRIDTHPTHPNHPLSSLVQFIADPKSSATPLYYAALCGFKDLVEHLAVKYPQDVNTRGGYYLTPFVAAMAGRHFQIVEHLRQNGADVNVRHDDGEAPLLSAAWFGDLEIVQALLDYGVDVNARGFEGWTPMHCLLGSDRLPATPHNGPQLLPNIARLLLEHGADANARMDDGRTPLHIVAGDRPWDLCHGDGEDSWKVEIVRMLLEHGADVGVEDNEGRTVFQVASAKGRIKIMNLVSEYGAKGVL